MSTTTKARVNVFSESIAYALYRKVIVSKLGLGPWMLENARVKLPEF